ncbi:hypothetical protein DFJ74DRAFT_735328 [Hyaloraphidium curvatum]|nr:hypothetical protein DFJ74DRAFT_735328 [Hyaloraphidium curvatum]
MPRYRVLPVAAAAALAAAWLILRSPVSSFDAAPAPAVCALPPGLRTPLLPSGIPAALAASESRLDDVPPRFPALPPWILLANPSVAAEDAEVLSQRGFALVAFRASFNGSTPTREGEKWPPQGNFFVVLRAFRFPRTPEFRFRGRLADLEPGRFVHLDAAPHPSERSECPLAPYHGYLDPRPVVLPDGRLLVLAKSPHPRACASQRIAAVLADLEELLALSFPNGASSAEESVPKLAPRSVVYLSTPNMRPTERNWIPFVSRVGELLLSYSLDPHVVLRCDIDRTGACDEVARTSFPGLAAQLGVPSAEVHGGSQGVPHSPTERVAIGHFDNGTWPNVYHFFAYSFSALPPYALLRAGRPFRAFGPESGQGFLSGLSRVGDWYAVSYGRGDVEGFAGGLHACELEGLLAGGVARDRVVGEG